MQIVLSEKTFKVEVGVDTAVLSRDGEPAIILSDGDTFTMKQTIDVSFWDIIKAILTDQPLVSDNV